MIQVEPMKEMEQKKRTKVLGVRSLRNLVDVHPDLRKIIDLALVKLEGTSLDFTVICGHRTAKEQMEAYRKGYTKVMKSKHMELPSRAFDFIPYPFDNNWVSPDFAKLGKLFLECAKELNILARWGGDWNMNGTSTDEKFYDSGHFELLTSAELEWIKKNYEKKLQAQKQVVNK